MRNLLTTACITLSLCLLSSSAVAQCQSSCQSSSKAATQTIATAASHTDEAPQKDIVETALGNEDFSTLVAAVKAAGLVEALQGEGPFTVFAPTNEAFAKLPPETIEFLLKPENKDQLTAILTFHVVSGKIMAKDVLKAMKVDTLQGSAANIGLTINGANVVVTDIECSNGVIHVIDTVITPEK